MVRLLLVITFALTTLSLTAQEHRVSAQKQIEKLNSCYQILQDSYIDEIPFDKCVEGAIIATLKELDPHSTYLTKAEMDAAMSSLSGNFSGVGIRYVIIDGEVVVRGIEPGSPAQKAGLGHNDRIVAIEGKPISEYDDVMAALKGKKGSKVSVDVIRARTKERATLTITRNDINVSAIDSSHLIDDDKVGYIKISHFSRNVDQEFQKAVKELGKFESLIIDLRGNSGGVLTSAIRLCDLFLDKGEIIVTTEGRSECFEYASRSRGSLLGTPLVVLIDEASASASEIFAGAMQDHDRGLIVGATSFGKGLVQRQIPFDDGSAMRITIAHYKTPSGRIIQRPYEKGHSEEYFSDTTRYNNPESIQHDSTLVYYTLRSGRKVYGGGGITPDIFIDSNTELPEYMIKAYESNAFQRSLIELWDNISHEDILRDYPTLKAFDEGYVVDKIMIDYFCKIVGDQSAREDRELLYPILKAQIAEDVYGKGAYQYVFNRHYDITLTTAIELAKKQGDIERVLQSPL